MKDHFKYFKFMLQHKWYVFIECVKLGIFWRGIKHDLGKFRPRTFNQYSQRFAAGNGYASWDSLDYNYVFASHLRRSEHHWQYWCYVRNSGEIKYLPMSDRARKEFLADLRGSSRYYGTFVSEWYIRHRGEIHLHSETKEWLESQLGVPPPLKTKTYREALADLDPLEQKRLRYGDWVKPKQEKGYE